MSTSEVIDESRAVAPYAPPSGGAPLPVVQGPPPLPVTDDASAEASGDPAVGELTIAERAIPAEVSAAWELELLIAGAVTFALFQIPGSLESALAWVEARTSGTQAAFAAAGYMYAKAIVYVLIVAFLLNLCARAYWVGLVGLHSVFPRGVRWERMGSSAGPYAIAEYKRRLASLPAVIGRVDNFASVIFSFAFLIVITFFFSVIGLAALTVISWGISRLFGGALHPKNVLVVLSALVILPLIVGGTLDKFYGKKLDPESRGGRALRRTMRFAAYVNGSALFGPIFLTLFTNLSKRVMLPLFYGAVGVAMLLGAVDTLSRMRGLSMGGSVYVPDNRDLRGVANDYYESLRDKARPTTGPLIQSDVITGPFVRLFIPFRADRHDPWLAAHCPGAQPLRKTSLHLSDAPADPARADSVAARTLACLGRLHAVAVDGTPRPELEYRFYTHPTTGRDGIITYIPTGPLPPGMHTLRIQPAPRNPQSKTRTPLQPYEIAFWR
jgi:hypothetical protein